MSDTPKELALELTWHGSRVQILLVNGDRVLHSDVCDPRSDNSRAKAIAKLRAKFPAIDPAEVENQLLEMARKGPAKAEVDSGAAVDANPEPWPDEVDGAELLDELVALLVRYVVLPVFAAETVALWILHTFCFDCFEFTARLLIHSAEKRSGKSRLLRLLVALVSRPLSCEGISAAALFRSIEKFRPTLLLDEADTFLRGKNVNEDLRGVINAGHQRGGKVIRCVGDDSEPCAFNCFGPLAIAMIGKPPATVEDRSIPLMMRRRMPGERIERHAAGQSLRARFSETAQRCVRWAADNRDALATAQPAVPNELDDRAADCWFALLAIADRAGDRWSCLARQAAVGLMAGRDSSSDSLGVMLLQDLKDLFAKNDVDRMSSASIVTELSLLEDRPWPEYRRDKPITPRQLAKLLEPFGVSSKSVRLPNGTTPKGYYAVDFTDAWSRYLGEAAPSTPSGSATPPHACPDNGLRSNSSATATEGVADRNEPNPLENNACGGVADEKGGPCASEPPREPMAELRDLVEAMADELDAVREDVPFRGEALREHYREMVRLDDVEAALTDAQARYQAHLLGDILPLRRVAE